MTALTIYSKTSAGMQELMSRALHLSPVARRVLILVDGRRSATDLRQIAGQTVDLDSALGQLDQAGLIIASGTAEPPAAEPKKGGFLGRLLGRSAGPTVEHDPATRERISTASMQLHDMLGPSADSLMLKIEAAVDAEAVESLLAYAAEVLLEVRGAAASRKFREAVRLPV